MKARTRSFIVTAIASATVLFAAGCDTQETIFSSQLETIRTWITSQSDNNGPDYEEVASGVYRAIILPDDGRGAPFIAAGDSLYVWYEIYQFSSGFQRNNTSALIYTNKKEKMPTNVRWDDDVLKLRLGDGSLLRGVEKSLDGCAQSDTVSVVLTSSNAYGKVQMQQVPPTTPLIWFIDVEKVIKNE